MNEPRKGRALGLGLDALIPGGSHKAESNSSKLEDSSSKLEVITHNAEDKSPKEISQSGVRSSNLEIDTQKVDDQSSNSEVERYKVEVKPSKIEGNIPNVEVRSNNSEGITSKVELRTHELEVKPTNVEGMRHKEGGEAISDNLEVRTSKPEAITDQPQVISYNSEVISHSILDAEKNPRISLWSPLSTAVLKYLKKTTPEFSISEEACGLLEDAIARKYPELSREIMARREKT
jgi:hypothetical protein